MTVSQLKDRDAFYVLFLMFSPRRVVICSDVIAWLYMNSIFQLLRQNVQRWASAKAGGKRTWSS